MPAEEKIIYTVTATQKCAECNGEGYIFNPIYDEWRTAECEWKAQNPPPTESDKGKWFELLCQFGDQWFADNGYPGGMEHWPQEEWQCDKCNGAGKTETWVELAAAIQNIMKDPDVAAAIRRYF